MTCLTHFTHVTRVENKTIKYVYTSSIQINYRSMLRYDCCTHYYILNSLYNCVCLKVFTMIGDVSVVYIASSMAADMIPVIFIVVIIENEPVKYIL